MQDKVRNGMPEDAVTGAIESQTSKIPSSGYLAAAFGAIAASAILKAVGKDDHFCRSMAGCVHADGCLQQDGEAARLGRLQQSFS